MFPEGIQYSPLLGVKECISSYLAWHLVMEGDYPVPEIFVQHAIETENQKELIDRDIDKLMEVYDNG